MRMNEVYDETFLFRASKVSRMFETQSSLTEVLSSQEIPVIVAAISLLQKS